MLSQVLIRHTLRTLVIVLLASAVIAFLYGGWSLAQAIIWGGSLVGASGMIQMWLVGYLFDPSSGTPQKIVAGLFLTFKLLIVCVVLWWLLSRGPDVLGVMVGMLVGLMAVVIGASQGAASPEGQAAMNEAEKKIEEKLEDTDSEKR